MAAKAKIKCVAYLRVSGKGQETGGGFPRQEDAIQKYCKFHKLNLVDTYRDTATGTKESPDREGLAMLLDRLSHNGVSLVLVERADRLARDLLVGEIILGQFRDLGVVVKSVDGDVDLTVGDGDPTRKLIRQVLAAVSEFDKSIIVAKLKAARDRQRRLTGRCEGRKPFGHYPGEKATLDLMRKLRRKPRGLRRLSCSRIAVELNRRGLPTRMGKQWAQRTVQNILNRP